DCVCWRRPTELREPQGSLAQEEKDASLFARIPHLSAIAQVVGVFNGLRIGRKCMNPPEMHSKTLPMQSVKR
ncbi:hypothetical protein, partial [Paenibacillus elgii]|uniref:hypothetical protein n=1 Tax=Paenibacillus elgii TaxID=189691 RepID=UPI001E4AA93A